MLMNMPQDSMSFTTPPISLRHSKKLSFPSTMTSQQTKFIFGGMSLFSTTAATATSVSSDVADDGRITTTAIFSSHECITIAFTYTPPHPTRTASVNTIKIMDESCIPVIAAVLDEFKTEPIQPAIKQLVTRAKTDTTLSVTSENSPSTMYYSRKKAPPHRNETIKKAVEKIIMKYFGVSIVCTQRQFHRS
jgi:hypothetical protein